MGVVVGLGGLGEGLADAPGEVLGGFGVVDVDLGGGPAVAGDGQGLGDVVGDAPVDAAVLADGEAG
ncbi:hypothetical protein ACWGR4_46075 [Embleya sp. NPDC055664]